MRRQHAESRPADPRPRAVVRSALATLTCVGLATALVACGSADPATPAATPSTVSTTESAAPTSAPSSSAPAEGDDDANGGSGGGDAILAGERQVVISPQGSFESVVAVDDKGRLNLTDGPSDKTLFVLDPVSQGRHQIKTAKADTSGEPSCMGLKDDGKDIMTVVAAACDTSAQGQLFKVEPAEGKDSKDRPLYTIIGEEGASFQVGRNGLVAALGIGTKFSFVDNGPSELPSLD